MAKITVSIPVELKSKMDSFPKIDWSAVVTQAFQKKIKELEKISYDMELSQETIEAIERARKRMKKGHFLTEEQARKKLGL